MTDSSDNKRATGTGTVPSGNAESAHTFWSKALAVALWILVWQLASMLVGSNILLSGPIETLARLGQLLVRPGFLSIVGFSFARIMGGFLAAYATGVVLAFVAHRWPAVGELCAPAIHALKSVPIACVIVLLLMWVGSRAVSGPAVFLAVFPAVYFSCAEGLAHVDMRIDEMLAVFRTSAPVRLLAHVWPQTLPYLVGTAKNVCGMAWKAGIAAELIGSPMGSMGERIYQSKILLETADLFSWTIVVVVLSVLCERIFVALLSQSDSAARRLALWIAAQMRAAGGGTFVPASIILGGAALGYGDTVVVRDVELDLAPSSRTVLTDASGAGKTTLIRTVAGLQGALGGSVLVIPPEVSVVFQESRLLERMTAVENVRLVVHGAADEPAVRHALEELLPPDALDVPVAELSGGQRRRVEIVRALLCPSSTVVLDEPFASLDDATHERSAAFVLRHLEGRTLLVASHAKRDSQLLEAKELRLFERQG